MYTKDKVIIRYWTECITPEGIKSFSSEETLPLDGLISMGTDLQTTMIDDTLNTLSEDAIAIIDSGVVCHVHKDKESEYEPSSEDFEPRLQHIVKYYEHG